MWTESYIGTTGTMIVGFGKDLNDDLLISDWNGDIIHISQRSGLEKLYFTQCCKIHCKKANYRRYIPDTLPKLRYACTARYNNDAVNDDCGPSGLCWI